MTSVPVMSSHQSRGRSRNGDRSATGLSETTKPPNCVSPDSRDRSANPTLTACSTRRFVSSPRTETPGISRSRFPTYRASSCWNSASAERSGKGLSVSCRCRSPLKPAIGPTSATRLVGSRRLNSRARPARGVMSSISLFPRSSSRRLEASSRPCRSRISLPHADRLVRAERSSVVIGAPASLPNARSTAARNAASRNGERSFTSSSALSPTPSWSASSHSVASYGNGSFVSGTPSPSSSGSVLSPMPSPSKSTHSVGSSGTASASSTMPSPSASGPGARRAAAWKRTRSRLLAACAPAA